MFSNHVSVFFHVRFKAYIIFSHVYNVYRFVAVAFFADTILINVYILFLFILPKNNKNETKQTNGIRNRFPDPIPTTFGVQGLQTLPNSVGKMSCFSKCWCLQTAVAALLAWFIAI